MRLSIELAALLIVVIALLVWGANRLAYYPSKYPDGSWALQEQLGATDVRITASDGTKLDAWWIPAKQSSAAPHRATLHLHGNAGNITHRAPAAQSILAAGSAVLLLDYRGYGRSEGRPTERGLHRDAEAAFDWIVSHGYAPQQIVIHGESLGTAIATHLAARRQCAGLVLEAPLTSARAMAANVIPVLGPMLVWGFNNIDEIRDVHVPVLVIHGDRDDVIPYQFGQAVFAAANEPKWFWSVAGATHNDLHSVGESEFPTKLAGFYAHLTNTRP